ncbi:MAG: response regulator [Candidatus Latescibacterota bacterium]
MAQRVLILENDREYQLLLAEIVEGLGYEPVSAVRVGGALRALQHDIISLVLLDVKMPHLHGTDFVRYVRGKGNRISVIVVSAYLTRDVLQELAALGVRHVIAKPFTVRRLAEAMTEWLEEKRA